MFASLFATYVAKRDATFTGCSFNDQATSHTGVKAASHCIELLDLRVQTTLHFDEADAINRTIIAPIRSTTRTW